MSDKSDDEKRKRKRANAGTKPGRTTRAKIRAFLSALADSGNIRQSCEAANVSRTYIYDVRRADPAFAQAWDEAIDDACDLIIAEAHRRAVRGVKVPVYQGGKLVGHKREYSDTLLMFLLKAWKPEVYRDPVPGQVREPEPPAMNPEVAEAARRAAVEKALEMERAGELAPTVAPGRWPNGYPYGPEPSRS